LNSKDKSNSPRLPSLYIMRTVQGPPWQPAQELE
jgi:hypothetical protein